MNTKQVSLPASYNYIGIFLTFRCPYRCSYCINHFNDTRASTSNEVTGKDWCRFFRRLNDNDVPITLQGGEPGCHPDFIQIVKETLTFRPVDILTNLAFDLGEFIAEIDPQTINRKAPYAPIRVSYHPEQFPLKDIVQRVKTLMRAGFRVGLYGVEHPNQEKEIENAVQLCAAEDIDFRTKPFLGWHDGKLCGQYAFPDACRGTTTRYCECAPSELLIAPDGSIHRCHLFCYDNLTPLASIFDDQIDLTEDYIPCNHFGQCNPCDIKIKNNRFQQFGHVATKIRNITPPLC